VCAGTQEIIKTHSRIASARPNARTNGHESTRRRVALFPSDKVQPYYFAALKVVTGCSLVNMHANALIQRGTLFFSVPLPTTQIINPPVEYSPHCELLRNNKRHRSFIMSCLLSGVEFTAVAV
jgi:hypothetical protein